MALEKCPECGRDTFDSVTGCSYCGFCAKETESPAKSGKRNRVIIIIALVIAFFLLMFICGSVLSSRNQMKTFQKNVDEFVQYWDELAEKHQAEYDSEREKRISIDLMEQIEQMLCFRMRDISKSYVKFKDKTKVNDYLEEHTNKDMFEYVMKLLEEDGEESDIDKEFIDFYTEMEGVDKVAIIGTDTDIVGNWDGIAIYSNDKLTPIEKGSVTAVINNDNTYEFKVNEKTLSGVWAEIDSSSLQESETAYNFVMHSGEQVAQGILSTSGACALSVVFVDGDLWVQFEK